MKVALLPIVLALPLAACGRADRAVGDCSDILENDWGLSGNTPPEFSSWDMETQYKVFICVSQTGHPAPISFAFDELVPRGEPVARFFIEKPSQSDDDFTVWQTLTLLQWMQTHGTFDVSKDAALMQILHHEVRVMKNRRWRHMALQDISDLQVESEEERILRETGHSSHYQVCPQGVCGP